MVIELLLDERLHFVVSLHSAVDRSVHGDHTQGSFAHSTRLVEFLDFESGNLLSRFAHYLRVVCGIPYLSPRLHFKLLTGTRLSRPLPCWWTDQCTCLLEILTREILLTIRIVSRWRNDVGTFIELHWLLVLFQIKGCNLLLLHLVWIS